VNLSQTDHGSGCGLLRGRDGGKRKAPRVVLAGGPDFAAHAAEYLYLMGLDVCSAASAEALHSLAVRSRTAAVVLPVETAGESGFLTCAKLRLSRPKLKVVLVGKPTARSERFARFLGADFTTEADAADAVMKLI
jgi:DNA-binding response OmpR family regulator